MNSPQAARVSIYASDVETILVTQSGNDGDTDVLVDMSHLYGEDAGVLGADLTTLVVPTTSKPRQRLEALPEKTTFRSTTTVITTPLRIPMTALPGRPAQYRNERWCNGTARGLGPRCH